MVPVGSWSGWEEAGLVQRMNLPDWMFNLWFLYSVALSERKLRRNKLVASWLPVLWGEFNKSERHVLIVLFICTRFI